MKHLKSLNNFDVDKIGLVDFLLLSSACQFELFSKITNHSGSIEEVLKNYPEKCDVIKNLIYALIAYGYLLTDGKNLLKIHPTLKKLLDKGKAIVFKNYDWYFLIAQASNMPQSNLRKSLSAHTYNNFIDISESLSQELFPRIKHLFPKLLSDKYEVLDLGCGKLGLFRSLLEINSKLRVTAVEKNRYPTQYLRSIIKDKFPSNIELIEKDAIQAVREMRTKYDFILLSHLLHWLSEKDVRLVLKRCNKLLKKGGRCLIYEDYLASDNLSPRSSVRKNLSLSVLGYQVFNEQELEIMLEENGFKNIKKEIISERRILLYCN